MVKATRTSIICESPLHVETAIAELRRVEPLLALCAYRAFRARKDTVTRATPNGGRLPRYVERNPCNGSLSFRVGRGARTPLPNDPTTSEFHRAYNAALVDAIAAENDSDE
jgi:hypothetical protein